MVVGNKSDGGQTQESDGGNTICTSSREKSIIVKKSIIKQREKYYGKKSIIKIIICTSSRDKSIIQLLSAHQTESRVLLLRKSIIKER